jgi:hypothetical protein
MIKLKTIQQQISKNSPSILAGLGAAGVVSTAILAVKATPQALILLESEAYRHKCQPHELEPLEVIQAAYKPYIPAILSGVLTIGAIVSSNSINLKRNAALVGLYSIAVEGLQEYQRKVIETIGEKKELDIRDEIAQDKLKANPVENKEIYLLGGDALFYDSLSGRYFKSSMETVRKSQNDFNHDLLTEMYKPLNDFYDLIGLEDTEMGRNQGWNVDNGQLDIQFSTKLATNGEPCVVLTYKVGPRFL